MHKQKLQVTTHGVRALSGLSNLNDVARALVQTGVHLAHGVLLRALRVTNRHKAERFGSGSGPIFDLLA